jgi:DNA repair protein RadC
LVHPREVFKAVILGNAAAIIVVHNHPSGDPTPSAEDTAITQRLRQAGELLGIKVLDHVIIARAFALSESVVGNPTATDRTPADTR